jgi:hypothetical protein
VVFMGQTSMTGLAGSLSRPQDSSRRPPLDSHSLCRCNAARRTARRRRSNDRIKILGLASFRNRRVLGFPCGASASRCWLIRRPSWKAKAAAAREIASYRAHGGLKFAVLNAVLIRRLERHTRWRVRKFLFYGQKWWVQ